MLRGVTRTHNSFARRDRRPRLRERVGVGAGGAPLVPPWNSRPAWCSAACRPCASASVYELARHNHRIDRIPAILMRAQRIDLMSAGDVATFLGCQSSG